MQADIEGIQETTVEPDLFPPGARVSFIYTEDKTLLEKLQACFDSQGYYTATASDPVQGAAKLRLNSYDVAVLDHRKNIDPLLDVINCWPGLSRRALNIIIIGEKAPSLHQRQALVQGVNFYLNLQDLKSMEDLILQCLRGYQIYYHPWQKVMEEVHDK
ncbi:hypothetical protein [Desulfonatronospira sp.]|uniref:hypothetical protein n=1 Tax=Desulfonatronospira sp. TaxID=1962951 RepID=UPI0025C1E241|nr:hypothetical protein [Desulfonatronospira sp.]